jgi:hypothetical protein
MHNPRPTLLTTQQMRSMLLHLRWGIAYDVSQRM